MRVRLSVKGLLATILFFGLLFSLVRMVFFSGTIYSPEYSESRFQSIRVGMTAEEVEALMGPPLKKVPWPYGEGYVYWMYTDNAPGHANYWMRNVYLEDGKVVDTISMYWID